MPHKGSLAACPLNNGVSSFDFCTKTISLAQKLKFCHTFLCKASGLSEHFAEHHVVNHGMRQYVQGDAYTNTAESFFAIAKRGHYGIFHSMSKKHLHRYFTEFDFKWNHRQDNHIDTVATALGMGDGKRLMYKDLIRS